MGCCSAAAKSAAPAPAQRPQQQQAGRRPAHLAVGSTRLRAAAPRPLQTPSRCSSGLGPSPREFRGPRGRAVAVSEVEEEVGPDGRMLSAGDYDFDIRLGSGSFGTVHAVLHARGDGDGSKAYALKSISKAKLTPQQLQSHAWGEAKALALVSGHPNVIFLQAVLESSRYVHVVVEYVRGSDLGMVLRRDAPLSEFRAKLFYQGIAAGLAHCHQQGVVHRDVKPENIMVAQDTGVPKLSDFGLAACLAEQERLYDQCGTPQYVAPEVVTHEGRGYLGPPVDVWSTAVVLYEMLTAHLPFSDAGERGLPSSERLEALYGRIAQVQWQRERLVELGQSEEAAELLDQLFAADPEQRLTVGAALRHPWLQSTLLGRPGRQRQGLRRSSLRRMSTGLSDLECGPLRELLQQLQDQPPSGRRDTANGRCTPGQPGVPERVGRYVLGVPLGRDHLGMVHACSVARDAELPAREGSPHSRRASVLKLRYHPVVATSSMPFAIRCLDLDEADVFRRFAKEVNILTRVECPNVARIWETFAFEGNAYTVMDLVIGSNLRLMVTTQEVQRRSFKRKLPYYLLQMVRTLAFLHQEGIVHRRLRLESLMLDIPSDQIIFTDFSNAVLGKPVWERYLRCSSAFSFLEEAAGPVVELGVDFDSIDDVARLACADDSSAFIVSEDGTRARSLRSYTVGEEPATPGEWALHLFDPSVPRQGPFASSPNSAAYNPPELAATGECYGEPADVWALGLVIYRVCEPGVEPFEAPPTAEPPTSPQGPSRLRPRLNRSSTYACSSSPSPVSPGVEDSRTSLDSCSTQLEFRSVRDPVLMALLRGMLQGDPEARLSAKAALQHPYFSGSGPPNKVPLSPSHRSASPLAAGSVSPSPPSEKRS
eukprot:TRINITY_DN20598_c0_g1_i1.p1 TRINITY_DN20598_c0_g1~~TRINITY_DN20598_c0_g1_i1.p1  ORF type:complete len:880 (+),score=239.27 TRINITY_DN20598_c0_g1_i1:156-2795(+)